MNEYQKEDFNREISAEYANSAIIEMKESSNVNKWGLIIVGIMILLIIVFGYLWSIRPIYHSYFFRVSAYTERGGVALLVFNDNIDTNRGIIIGGVGGRRHLLVNVETGRQIRLSYLPWRNYGVSNLISSNLVVVRNLRSDQVALMDINTRQKIVPFDTYHRFWEFRDNLATVIYDGYMGVINTQTGEEIFPPNYFTQIRFIYGTDRFVAATKDSAEFDRDERYRWGVLCLYTHELLTQLAYLDLFSYQDGMVDLNQRGSAKLVDLTTGKEIIPFGEFFSIRSIGYNVAEVRHWSNLSDSALIEIVTRDMLSDFGEFNFIHRAYNYEARVSTQEYDVRRHGTFNFNNRTVVWDDELTYEELSQVHAKFNIRPWSPPIPDYLSHYDQVRILSNGWALVRNGDFSRFVEITPSE